jgi:hypothetical protein
VDHARQRYRRLAESYAATPGRPLAVCQLDAELIENKATLETCNGLELLLMLPDRAMCLLLSSQGGSSSHNEPTQSDRRKGLKLPDGDVAVAPTLAVNEIRESNGAGLTKHVATTLLTTLANHMIVRYLKQQGVQYLLNGLVS